MVPAELKRRLLRLGSQARAEQLAFIARLSQEQRAATGTPERWSAKDLVAHVAAWWRTQGQRFALVADGQHPATFAWSDEANDAVFAENHARSWTEIEAEAAISFTVWMAAIEALGLDDLMIPGRIEAMGNQPLWRLVLGNGYLHPRMHLSEHEVECREVARAVEIQESIATDLDDLIPDLRGMARYNLACFYARIGRLDDALERLAGAFQADGGLRMRAGQDPDLIALRALPSFQTLLAGDGA